MTGWSYSEQGGESCHRGPPRGVVCRYSARWGAALCFNRDFVPGAESFQKTSQGSWRTLWEFWPCLKWDEGETLA